MEEDIVIMHQDQIEVYVTESCGIAVKAMGDGGYREDQIVIIRPENIDVLIEALKKTKKEAIQAKQEAENG
jgi:hypothetical protein